MSRWNELLESVERVEPSPAIPARALARAAELGERPARRVGRTAIMLIAAGAACCLVVAALALAAHSRSSAPAPATPVKDSAQFIGLPPAGAHPSLPAHGQLVAQASPPSGSSFNVYADGRFIWLRRTSAGDPAVIPPGETAATTQYVQQRLTPNGVRLLRSRTLEIAQPAGLADHDLRLAHGAYASYDIPTGTRLVSVELSPPSDFNGGSHRTATPAQVRALGRITSLLANAADRLPASAWADRTIRPYVPSHYLVVYDRFTPDPSQLSSPARQALAQYGPLHRSACQLLTTDQVRALLSALTTSRRVHVVANNAAPAVRVPAVKQGVPGWKTTTVLSFRVALPNDRC